MHMRRKVSTLLDEALFRRAKLESARQGKQISEIVGEALEQYLSRGGSRRGSADLVTESWGVLTMRKSRVQRLLAEEEGLLDT